MNIKKFAITSGIVFALLLFTDFLTHQVIMKGYYQESASLWRTQDDIQQFMPLMIFGQILTAIFFTAIFIHGYKGKGFAEGIRYGAMISAYNAGHTFVMYAVTPWSATMVAMWLVLGTIQAIVLGVACTLVYKSAKN